MILTSALLLAALQQAAAAWGVPTDHLPVIVAAPMNACDLRTNQPIADTYVESHSSTIQPIDLETGAPIGDLQTIEGQSTSTITVNSNCHWSYKWLVAAVSHELGHVLIENTVAAHSTDANSVMFWAVSNSGRQRVTDADRERIRGRK